MFTVVAVCEEVGELALGATPHTVLLPPLELQ
jgi:hypothetical protein